MSLVQVHSEIGRLRRALVHEPGPEVDHMVPSMMEELLFDDILFGAAARKEHRRFCRVLEALGVEVLDAQALLATALRQAEARRFVLEPFQDVVPPALLARLHDTLIPLRDDTRRTEEGEPTRIVSPLKKVIVRALTPKPGAIKTPKAPRT